MLKLVQSIFVIVAATMFISVNTGAEPLAHSSTAHSTTVQSDGSHILKVRDGCGPGYYYSRRADDCVRMPPPRRYEGQRTDGRSCKQQCSAQQARCEERRGGYFNGCGFAYATCLAGC
jgi:hypothetical protein